MRTRLDIGGADRAPLAWRIGLHGDASCDVGPHRM